MRKPRVLVVDDEAGVRRGIRRFLEASGYDVTEGATCGEAETAFLTLPPDAAIIDHRLPDGHGVDLVPRLKELCPAVPLIVLTAHGTIEMAVRAIKEGADHFLTKPVELSAVLLLLERVLENQRARRRQLAGSSRERESIDPFLGSSAAIRRLAEEARKVQASESPILIRGETGTGKGVLARWLHAGGPRAGEAFVDLNCAALSRELLQTELFGHEKGAFTGAADSKTGLLEVAHHGTVFLDEIGDMDAAVQPKLLTVLEEGRFRRLGGVHDRRVDIRLIAATHQDLHRLVAERLFRRDLYFRVSTIPLTVPPLRSRREDIPALAQHFLGGSAAELGRGDVSLSKDALEALLRYSWPGNIRELRNVLERALLLGEKDVIRRDDLQFFSPGELPASGSVLTLDELERREIERALEAEGGHVERAALRLAIPRSSLYKKIKKHGIQSRYVVESR